MTDADAAGRLRVLLVEDEKLNRDLVRAILARAGDPVLRDAHLVEAGTLDRARAALAAEPFDILLLDVHLPDGSGLSLAAELDGHVSGPRPAVIALTAGVFPDQRTAAVAAGCDAILGKPHTAAELLAALAAHLPGAAASPPRPGSSPGRDGGPPG